MADQHRRTTAGGQQANDGVNPVLDVGLVPAALDNALENRRPALPITLPVFGTAVLEARDENEIETRRERAEFLDCFAHRMPEHREKYSGPPLGRD